MRDKAVVCLMLALVLWTPTFVLAGPRRAIRQRSRARVNTPWEVKADKNRDGVVQPREVRKARVDRRERGVVDRTWEAMADTDNDGRVSPAELRRHHRKAMDRNNDGKIDVVERKTFWIAHKAKVNTPVEARYDTDRNGWIEGDEAGQYLRDRLLIITTHGRAKVDTAIEAAFDADNNGIIDEQEADAIRDALGD